MLNQKLKNISIPQRKIGAVLVCCFMRIFCSLLCFSYESSALKYGQNTIASFKVVLQCVYKIFGVYEFTAFKAKSGVFTNDGH